MRLWLSLPLLLAWALAPTHASDRWPQFRGPAASGLATGTGLPDTWDNTRNIAWSIALPGKGWSSPVAWGDRIFVTSAVSSDKVEPPRKGLYIENVVGKSVATEQRWTVTCLDFRTGKVLWERVAHQGVPRTPIHVKNSLASETPVTDGERVYAYFGNVGLFCYDLEGKLLWSQKVDPAKTRFGWGPAASPVLHQDRVYLVNDNDDQSYLAAYDKRTGKQVWRVDRDEKSNWATPFVWESGPRTELVTAGSGKVRSYDLEGKLLWELRGMSSIAIPTPVAGHGLLYVSSGYVGDRLRPVYAIRPGATGDITLPENATSSPHIAWCQRLAGAYHPTPLVYGDQLYVLYDRGFLACYDARTGKEVYDRQRLGTATAFTASPWGYDGKVFCLSEDGDTFVVQAGREFKLLGRNRLDDMALATPAVVHDSLILRTLTRLYRIARTAPAE